MNKLHCYNFCNLQARLLAHMAKETNVFTQTWLHPYRNACFKIFYEIFINKNNRKNCGWKNKINYGTYPYRAFQIAAVVESIRVETVSNNSSVLETKWLNLCKFKQCEIMITGRFYTIIARNKKIIELSTGLVWQCEKRKKGM